MSGRAWVAVGVAVAVAAFIVHRRARDAAAPEGVLASTAAATADALGQVRDAAAGAWESLTSGGGSSWWDQWSPSTVTKPPERSPDKSGNY